MMRFEIIFLPACLTFRLTLILQGQTLTFHVQFKMTKVMTSCQGHSNTVILRSRLYFKFFLNENEMSQVPVCYYVKKNLPHLSNFRKNTIRPYKKLIYSPFHAFGEAFSRIITDCAGPLPKTKSGC